ncbi:MDR family MFS transporter [Brevibacillus sp. TJ4]|uniref:MDR family MFS transporter n=1 Tax=Brevibacillus sp. TJ4 TaxID=3234853 RepID=UPI0037CFB9D5
MSKLRQAWQNYHPVVHLLMGGTVFVMTTQMMSIPFLAIYLSETTDLGPAAIGLIVGAGPLAGTFGGFLGGVCSDLFGRRKLLVFSMLTMAVSFILFVMASHPVSLFAISLAKGLAGAFFGTISKAMMGDFTPAEKRFRVFSNRYLAINAGATLGPLLGAWIGIAGSGVAFVLTALSYVLFAILLTVVGNRYREDEKRFSAEEGQVNEDKAGFFQIWDVLRRDTALQLFVIGGILLVTVHGQMSVTLSQYLRDNVAGGVALFGLMMSVNGFTVLVLQITITRLAERYSLFSRIAAGAVLMAVGEAGFAFSSEWSGFIVAMIVFTLGEILLIPAEYAQIDQITPPRMRGTYYGAQSVSELGSFLGPWAGGMILFAYGGPAMFLTMGGIALFSLVFYRLGRSVYERRRSDVGL